jgi:dihydropteroate synthase
LLLDHNAVMQRSTYVRPIGLFPAPRDQDAEAWSGLPVAGQPLRFTTVEIAERNGARVSRRIVTLGDAVERDWGRGALHAAQDLEAITGARSRLAGLALDRPRLMGIINVTPDSFSDGGQFADSSVAASAGARMAEAGAAIVDVGGESTRPGSKPVWEGDEIDRIEPVIRQLASGGVAVSVDTRKADVMTSALGAGARMVNDVSALTYDSRSAETVAAAGVPVVLMHHKGAPETMQDNPRYEDVVVEVYLWLEERIAAAEEAGIERSNILVDIGFGFGKSVAHNLELMNNLALFHSLGCPAVVGASRKRTIGALSNEAPADERLAGSIAFAVKAADQGAQLIRVHDVPETVQALRVWRGLRDQALTPRV